MTVFMQIWYRGIHNVCCSIQFEGGQNCFFAQALNGNSRVQKYYRYNIINDDIKCVNTFIRLQNIPRLD